MSVWDQPGSLVLLPQFLCPYLFRYFFNKEGDFNNLTAATYHKKVHLLVTGFASGIFHLHELPEFSLIHSLRSAPLLYVHSCVHVCVRSCTCVCVVVYLCVGGRVPVCVQSWTCVYMQLCTCVCAVMYLCVCVQLCTRVYSRVPVCVVIYLCVQSCVHMCCPSARQAGWVEATPCLPGPRAVEGPGGLTSCMVGFPGHPSPAPTWVGGVWGAVPPSISDVPLPPRVTGWCVRVMLLSCFHFPSCIFGMWRKP